MQTREPILLLSGSSGNLGGADGANGGLGGCLDDISVWRIANPVASPR